MKNARQDSPVFGSQYPIGRDHVRSTIPPILHVHAAIEPELCTDYVFPGWHLGDVKPEPFAALVPHSGNVMICGSRKKRLINRASNQGSTILRKRESFSNRGWGIVECHLANRSSNLYRSAGSNSFRQIPSFLPSLQTWMDFYLVDRTRYVMGLQGRERERERVKGKVNETMQLRSSKG